MSISQEINYITEKLQELPKTKQLREVRIRDFLKFSLSLYLCLYLFLPPSISPSFPLFLSLSFFLF